MRCGSLFSGIGLLELGLVEWAELGSVEWQVELDPWCRSVLRKHFPAVERFEDVRHVGARNLAPIDLILGGFPCQDVSAAGKGAGLTGARSGLWSEFRRITSELRPSFVVVENVASGAARWVDRVRGDLGQLGYKTIPIPLSARDVGAPHGRARVFVIGQREMGDADRARLAERQRQRSDTRAGRSTPDRTGGQVGDADELADADELSLRHQRQRVPGRRPAGVRPQGQAESSNDGEELADADSGRREGEWIAQHRGEQGSCRGELDRRRDFRQQLDAKRWPQPWPPAPDDLHAWRGLPVEAQPALCRMAHGGASSLDRDRFRALGNAVVPQCAQVIGEIVKALL